MAENRRKGGSVCECVCGSVCSYTIYSKISYCLSDGCKICTYIHTYIHTCIMYISIEPLSFTFQAVKSMWHFCSFGRLGWHLVGKFRWHFFSTFPRSGDKLIWYFGWSRWHFLRYPLLSQSHQVTLSYVYLRQGRVALMFIWQVGVLSLLIANLWQVMIPEVVCTVRKYNHKNS